MKDVKTHHYYYLCLKCDVETGYRIDDNDYSRVRHSMAAKADEPYQLLFCSREEFTKEGKDKEMVGCNMQTMQRFVGYKHDVEEELQPMSTAPKDEEILVFYKEDLDTGVPAEWSSRPVCMAGNINGGSRPGWSTGASGECETNLPLDPPDYWKPL